MPNNLKRFISGAIYIFLILFSIEKGFFNFLILIFSFLCIIEFLTFSSTKDLIYLNLTLYLVLLFLECFFKENFLYKGIVFLSFILILFIKVLFSPSYFNLKKVKYLSTLFFAWIYILLPTFLAIYIYLKGGKKLILFTFVFIWINDTFSYLIGKKWGKTKIITHISPNKSLEGYLGGVFFSLLIGIFFYLNERENYLFFLSVFIAFIASIGDLLESMIKRAYKIKDSSNLFPGHGGFLDRLDSFIFVIPFIFIFYLLIS